MNKHKIVLVNADVKASISKINSKFSNIILDLLSFFETTYRDVFGFVNGPPLHDPLTIAFAIDPTLFKFQKHYVEIETQSQVLAGQTTCDIWKQLGLLF